MLRNSILCVLVLITVVCPAAMAQPPFPPDDPQVAAPNLVPGRRGPAIGISVDNNHSFTRNGTTYTGVRVLNVGRNRSLYAGNGSGRWSKYRFSAGNDVITEVNGNSVSTSTEVLENTFNGWNSLKIYDRRSGSHRTYWVLLP